MKKRNNQEVVSEEPPAKKQFHSDARTMVLPLPSGTVLTDLLGNKWKLGKTIGTGGFGMIYLVSGISSENSKNKMQYVAKIESHTSGPLFVERCFYLSAAKPEMINEWKINKKLDHLGMPHYITSGSYVTKTSKYRFLIIPRFDKDLEEIFQEKNNKFNLKTVLTIALQTIEILEYIHSRGYVHSDIKASNILLENYNNTCKNSSIRSPVMKAKLLRYYGCTPMRTCKVRKLRVAVSCALRPNNNLHYFYPEETQEETVSKNHNTDKVYLLDYGLARRFLKRDGEHKEFCTDIRNAHAGTLMFCSRDAHDGTQSRRSDLECLGYNIVYWLTSNLPWSQNLLPENVHEKKIKSMENVTKFLDCSFNYEWPRFLFDYFTYLMSLEFDKKPDYDYCKNLFENAIREYGYKNNLLLDFDNREGWGSKQKKITPNNENLKKDVLGKIKRLPLKSNLAVRIKLRKKIKSKAERTTNWVNILDPEVIIKQAKCRERKITETSNEGSFGVVTPMNISELNQLNPTAAMKDVFNKSRGKINQRLSTMAHIEGYNSAMMQVYYRKKELEEMESHQLYMAEMESNKNKKKQTKKKPHTQQSTSLRCTRLKTNKKVVQKQKSVPIRSTYSLRG